MFSSPVSIKLSSGRGAVGTPPTSMRWSEVTETFSTCSIGKGR